MLWRGGADGLGADVMSASQIVPNIAPNIARSILCQLAVRGVDPGEAVAVSAGDRIVAERDGAPLVTLILGGVVARGWNGDSLCLGLAGPGEAVGFDPAETGQPETGLWLTPGRRIEVPLRMLVGRLEPSAVLELALETLRLKHAAARTEIVRHARLRVTDRLAALMQDIHDRSGETVIALRQSELAALLSVRRAGVSNACGELQALGAIRLRRGVIELIDRDALSQVARFTPP